MKNVILLLASATYVFFITYCQKQQSLPIWLLYTCMISSGLSFIFYGMDKLAAIKNWTRTPEKHFFMLALLYGWPGSVLGQVVFNHKTKKASFRRWFYMMLMMNIVATVGYVSVK